MQEIYRFVREGEDRSGIVGHFRATGVRPKFLAELRGPGTELPAAHFDPRASL